MSFFPVKYFLKKFFPATWFSGSAETGGQQFADMAATMTGSGTMASQIQATASLRCVMDGAGSMSGALSATVREVEQPVTLIGGGSWDRSEMLEKRQAVFADMAAVMIGSGRMTGALRATGAITCSMIGKGSMRAMPVIDITRLLQRRREEEEMMAVMLAVG